MPNITVKYAPRSWTQFKRPVWSDPRPYIVLVDGVIALDKQGRERRFESKQGAAKAFEPKKIINDAGEHTATFHGQDEEGFGHYTLNFKL